MPSLHVAELVGVDPVQGVRHAHLDRLDGLVALDPRGEALILLLVLDPGVVPCELCRHVPHDDFPHDPHIP